MREYINDQKLIANPAAVEAELVKGARRTRELSAPYLDQIRAAIGIRRLG